MEKVCNECKVGRDLQYFNHKKDSIDGYNNKCKFCMKNHKKQYYENNKEKIKEKAKKYRNDNIEKAKEAENKYVVNNKEIILLKKKEYYKNNKQKKKLYTENNKEYIKIKSKEYREKNKHRRTEYDKLRRKEDPLYKLTCSIRCMLRYAFNNKGYTKKSKTINIVRCSFMELKIYLESKFEPWMTWSNRGLYNGEFNYGWDIDHIMPLSSAKSEEELIKLNHYTNLQPLCSKVNRDIKKDNYKYI